MLPRETRKQMKVILMLPPLRATKIFFRFQATKKCIVKFPFRNILSLQQLFITLCPKGELISFQGEILGCRHSLNVIWMRSSSSVLVSLLYQLFYQLLFLIFLSYLSLTMGISFGVIGEMSPWCLIYKCCKINWARLIYIFLRIVLHPMHENWVEVFLTA